MGTLPVRLANCGGAGQRDGVMLITLPSLLLFPSDKQQAGTGVTAARRTAGPLLLERVHFTPVIGYLLAGTDPYPIVLRKVIEEPL